LPATALAALRRARIVAASERLAGFARECGFDDVVTARGPRRPTCWRRRATPGRDRGRIR
jgi:hypothetical protein